MKKTVRGLFCGAVASAVLLNSGFSVGAAGLRDIFDADYYAEKYSDLKEAYGDDENALYQHFINYGIKEGRVMNPVIDVVRYREQYKDLQEAFGDDWDAYINHYFTYGVNEHRENGTDFDLLAYLNAYGDLQEAYGDDYVALAKHYEELGIHENRVKASKAFVQMEQAAKQNNTKNEDVKGNGESSGGNEQGDAKQEYDVRETDVHFGTWTLRHYDGNGREMYSFYYDENGEVLSSSAYVYDEAGRVIQWGECNSDGSLKYAERKYEYDNAGNTIREWRLSDSDGNEGYVYDKYEYTYDSNGNMLTSKMYYSDGSVGDEIRYVYDSNGNLLTETLYNADGSSRLCVEYIYSNNILAEKWEYYIPSLKSEVKNQYIYDERGDVTDRYLYGDERVYHYSYTHEYAENGDRTTSMYSNGYLIYTYKVTHTSEGETRENFDYNGNITERKLISNNGTSVDISYKWESFEGSYYLQEKITYYINCDGPARNIREEYNTKGDTVSHKTYIGKDIVNDYEASYTSAFEYAEDGSKVETRYDLEGNVKEVINYNSKGEER